MRRLGLTPSNDPPPFKVPSRPQPKRGVMNKTETLYARILEGKKSVGSIHSFRFESITLQLAPGCRYTPDFEVVTSEPWEGLEIEFHEIKSGRKRKSGNVGPHMEDDARVKLLTAAELYPEFTFYLAWLWKGQWEVEKIG